MNKQCIEVKDVLQYKCWQSRHKSDVIIVRGCPQPQMRIVYSNTKRFIQSEGKGWLHNLTEKDPWDKRDPQCHVIHLNRRLST